MFYDHEVNFANQFVSASSISHMASNPAFFITGSMAEYHWPELWKLYDKYVKLISSTDEGDVWLERVARDGIVKSADKAETLKRYPHISTHFFKLRTELCYKVVLQPILGIDDYFIKYEFAKGRGEIHFHSLNWSSLHDIEVASSQGKDQDVVQFCRVWLRLSAVHPGSGDTNRCFHPIFNKDGEKPQRYGNGHPCKQLFSCITADEVDQFDIRMCNACFSHCCVKNHYCLRKRRSTTRLDPSVSPGTPGDKVHQCRFDYHVNGWSGKDSLSADQASIQESATSAKRSVTMERNDPFLVQHSKFFRRCWRANCDIQVIVTVDPVLIKDYVVKYVCKEGDASVEYQHFMKVILQDGNIRNSSHLVHKVMMHLLGHRDKSAQEVLFTATGGKYYSMSRSTGVKINISNFRMASGCGETKIYTGTNVADKYVKNLIGANQVSLYEYAMEMSNGKSVSLMGHFKYSWPVSEYLSRNLLLLHHPWTSKFDVLKNHKTGSLYLSFKDKFLEDFLFTVRCPLLIFKSLMYKKDQREHPGKYLRRREFSTLTAGTGELASFLKYFKNRSQETDIQADHMGEIQFCKAPPGYDWSNCQYNEEHLVQLESTARFVSQNEGGLPKLNNLEVFGEKMLANTEQRALIAYAVDHCNQCMAGHINPIYAQIIGGGGTGKSHVLKVIRACWNGLLKSNYATLVISPTAAAASLVDGMTIHCAMGWKVDLSDVGEERLAEIKARIVGAKYLLIDEKSMLDQDFLARIEQRISKFRGCSASGSWGGLWGVFFIGDDGQLSPARGVSMFDQRASTNNALMGFQIYSQFTTVFMLTTLVRQDDHEEDFKRILGGVKNGTLADADLALLNTRALGNIPLDAKAVFQKEDTISFFPYNVDRIQCNMQHISRITNYIAEFVSVDDGNPKHLRGHDSASTLCGLQPILWLGKGVLVTVSCNLSVPMRMAKGRTGVVQQVIYHNGEGPPSLPRLVLVKIFGDLVPELENCVPGQEKVVPFIPIKRRCLIGCCERHTLPLDVCAALTVHRCQGATITRETVVDLSAKAESQFPGITYTALSRFKTMTSFALANPFNSDIVSAIKRSLVTSGRSREFKRLGLLAAATKTMLMEGGYADRYHVVMRQCLAAEAGQ